ncbi:amidohydrolase [Antrihabitans stalactiti]
MTTELLIGGRIYSPGSPYATCMAVSNGTIVWIGADKAGRSLHPDANIVDLEGAFVAPGFVDSHVHTSALGRKLTGLDLTGAASLADCMSRLTRFAAEHPGELILGHGWEETRWPEGRPPNVADLEAAAPGRQVYLTRIDVHSAVCSSSLLDAVGGIASRDGLVRADDHHRVRTATQSAATPEQRDRARRAALDEAAANGIVAVHECAGPQISGRDDLRELRGLEHGVAIRTYWGEAVDNAEQATQLLADTGADGLAGDLFVDGALGSRTAWLHEPYLDDPSAGTGNKYLDVDAIAAHLQACTQLRVQAGFHVIGDAAVSAVIEALERVVDAVGGPAVATCGHRLEHVEMITPKQAAKLGAWGVIVSVQPVFDELWGGADGMYATRLGAQRAAAMNPFSTMASAGVSLAISSDAPVTALRPWSAVRAAVQHRTPGAGISPRAAFAAATRGAWRAGGVRDGVAGTLVPGAPATYAVWEVDDLVVASPDNAVARWSTDPRAGVPPLPRLDPGSPDPTCVRTVRNGVTIHA